MEPSVAKRIGRNEVLKSLSFAFILFELVYLLIQTKGDFANGILFFIDTQINVHFLVSVLGLYILNYICGSYIGRPILLKGKNYVLVGLMYGTLTGSLYCIYIAILFTVEFYMHVKQNSGKLFQAYSFELPITFFIVIMLSMILIWFWASKKINSNLMK